MIYKRLYKSPIGNLIIMTDHEKLLGLEYENPNNPLLFNVLIELKIINDVIDWLDRYFKGENPKINFAYYYNGSKFQNDVWERVALIPYGKTITYKDVADDIAKNYGIKKMSYQAVGTAIGKNPLVIIIPCHRVIGSNGLGGYSGGIEKKQRLLKIEKVHI